MNYDLYLKRQRLTLESLISIKKIKDYNELLEYFKSISIRAPAEEDVGDLFKKEVADVEERTADTSSSKKRRVSTKKSDNAKRSDSTSTRRSKSAQRVRKSPTKRKRKTTSDKVESIQPASGSDDIK